MKKSASNSTFLITFLIISFSSLLFAAQNRTCHPQDQIAINKIQTAFGLTPTRNCCDWDAVTCSDVAPFRVTSLVISDNYTISGRIPAAIGDLSSLQNLEFFLVPNITGNIPPAITKLASLSQLYISRTSLSGPFPSFLANLNSLTSLDLSGNAFTGLIPPQLSQLPSLTSLDLSGNAFTGLIPPQLSQLPNLQYLILDGNKLTGSIPESFGYFSSNMLSLSLSGNSLKGTIPKSLGNLNIRFVDLSLNSFTGDASFLFGKNKITLGLYLNGNKFNFDLSNVEIPSDLAQLTLDHNNIFGSLPQQLTQLNLNTDDIGKFDIINFDVSYNNLCGAIPQGGSLQSFGADQYSHNKCLCGAPLPPCK